MVYSNQIYQALSKKYRRAKDSKILIIRKGYYSLRSLEHPIEK